jgi:hypothetical protein
MNKGKKVTNEGDVIVEGEIIPYSKSEELAKFMDKPFQTIAEAVTGAISTGKYPVYWTRSMQNCNISL